MPAPSRRTLPRARGTSRCFEAVLIATSSGAMLFGYILAMLPWQWQNIPLIALIAWAAVLVFGPHCYWRPPFWRVSKVSSAVFIVVDEFVDSAVFSALLASIDNQKRKPSAVYVVASCHSQHCIVEAAFHSWNATSPIKRTALVSSLNEAIMQETEATVFAIVDGNRVVLDCASLFEGCKPFNDPAVTSVSGLQVSLDTLSLVNRSKEVGGIARQITEQAAYSRFGAAIPRDRFILCPGWMAKQVAQKETGLSPSSLVQQIAHNAYSKSVFMERCVIYTLLQETCQTDPQSWLRALCTDTLARVRDLPTGSGAWWLAGTQAIVAVSQPLGFALAVATEGSSLLTYVACWLFVGYAFTARALAMPSPSRRHGGIELCLLVLCLPLLIAAEILRALAAPGRTITAAAMGWQGRKVDANANQG